MKNRISLLLFTLFALLLCQPAAALDLQDAKSQGLVGEAPSGYLETVKSTPETKQLIKEINAKRKEHYQAIAKKNNTSLDSVEKMGGKKTLKKTPAGQYIKTDGKWKKK